MRSIADELARHSLCRDKSLGISPASWSCACGHWSRTVSFNAAVVLHATHVAAELRNNRTVRTVEELDALPDETVIRCGYGMVRHRTPGQRGWAGGDLNLGLPALVLWHPDLDAPALS